MRTSPISNTIAMTPNTPSPSPPRPRHTYTIPTLLTYRQHIPKPYLFLDPSIAHSFPSSESTAIVRAHVAVTPFSISAAWQNEEPNHWVLVLQTKTGTTEDVDAVTKTNDTAADTETHTASCWRRRWGMNKNKKKSERDLYMFELKKIDPLGSTILYCSAAPHMLCTGRFWCYARTWTLAVREGSVLGDFVDGFRDVGTEGFRVVGDVG